MSRKVKVRTVEYVRITDLVPEDWIFWFYDRLCQSDITWSGAMHTIISPERLYNECRHWHHKDVRTNMGAFTAWLKKLDSLPEDVYVDLEN